MEILGVNEQTTLLSFKISILSKFLLYLKKFVALLSSFILLQSLDIFQPDG